MLFSVVFPFAIIIVDFSPCQLHVIDDEFVTFLQKKVDAANDIEERSGMNSLLQTITTVLERVKEAQGDGDRDMRDDELTMDQVTYNCN
jgi:hypothetical protein